MASNTRKSNPRRREAPPKPAKRGTPIRNGLLLILFAVALTALVLILPKEPTGTQQATLIGGLTAVGDGTPENLALRLSEVMASNKRAYPDEKGNYPDWIEIENTSQETINLNGIGLSDRDDRVLFLFPDMDLAPGGFIVVFCDDTNAAQKDAPLHARFKVSAVGESIYLFDRSGITIDHVEIPPIASDVSYALTTGGWIETEEYTPGYPNTADGYAAFRAAGLVTGADLVINELSASNRTTLPDEDGEYSDWIELHNRGSNAVDLSYYALSDDDTNPVKWRFPQGAVIQPGEYYIVFASGKDRPGGDGLHPHTNFSLAAEGETVTLSDITHQTIDRVTYENLGKDTSWGRVEGLDNTWQEYTQPTPELPNNRSSEIEMDRRLRARNTSGIYISEVVTSSTGLETVPYGKTSYDWIEIVNFGTETVDLTNWGLSDSVSRPRKWQFPQVSIRPGQYLLVFPSGLTESPTNSGALHADFRLSALGETLVLSDPKGNIFDKLVVPKLERGNSYGRDFDQGGLFYYETPTGGEANTTQGFAGYADKPSISVKGGVYTQPVAVEITGPVGAQIRYTIDGSDPTETNGTLYTGPVVVSNITPLRARSFEVGLKPSDIATETYLVNVYHTLPIVAITVDPWELNNPETGMFAEDLEVKSTLTKVPFKQLAYWNKLPHPGNIEYYIDGVQVFNQGIEIQLHGQFSMDQAQKSLRITARKRYGDDRLRYAFFDDRPYQEYQSVILRNGGQDGKYTRIIDGLMSKIIDWTGADIIHMASTPVIAFINGQYYGHYNLRERINRYSIAAYEGWTDPDNMDLIKGDGNVLHGSYDSYGALIDFVKENDLNDPAALKTVTDQIDLDNYLDFMIFQTYFANTDAGNIKFYRYNAPGEKWRWVIFDLDWGYFDSSYNGLYWWLKEQGAGPQRNQNILIRKLLEVPAVLDQFLTRYGDLYQNFFCDTDRILEEADRMIAEIEPELRMHFQAWAGLQHPLVSSEEPASPEGLEQYWRSRVSRMENVLKKRPTIAWEQLQEWFELSDEDMVHYFGPKPPMPADVS